MKLVFTIDFKRWNWFHKVIFIILLLLIQLLLYLIAIFVYINKDDRKLDDDNFIDEHASYGLEEIKEEFHD